MTENYCNNCGKSGHVFHQCKIPITSNGIISFRNNNNNVEYLMICRKDTLGYIDFLRGKYNITDVQYIVDMVDQMTIGEKRKLLVHEFDKLWNDLWGENNIVKYKNEEYTSREKFNQLKKGFFVENDVVSIVTIIEKSNTKWVEPEWGFPKGRRNFQEKDYACALREFEEETGYSSSLLNNVNNICPFEEIFTGSNYKSYKHKYYLTYMKNADSDVKTKHQDCEVSQVKWMSYKECMFHIRDYNLEKKQVLKTIHNIITSFRIFLL